VFNPGNSCYTGSVDNLGFYLDDISVNHSETIISSSITERLGTDDWFELVPVDDATYRMSIQVVAGDLEYTYGPSLVVLSTDVMPVLYVAAVRAIGNGIFEIDFGVIDGWLGGFSILYGNDPLEMMPVDNAAIDELGDGLYRATLELSSGSNIFLRVKGRL
jgi:hypothetical protein